MRKNIKKLICFACILSLCGIMGVKYFSNPQEPVTLETVSASLEDQGAPSEEQKNANLKLNVKAAVLIDADTGKVLFEQDAHKELPPASVTKVMTMLLALEAVEDGKVKLSDKVTVSERAASMGGSPDVHGNRRGTYFGGNAGGHRHRFGQRRLCRCI